MADNKPLTGALLEEMNRPMPEIVNGAKVRIVKTTRGAVEFKEHMRLVESLRKVGYTVIDLRLEGNASSYSDIDISEL